MITFVVTTAAPTSSAASSAESATQSNKLAVQPQAEEATPGTSSGKTSAEGTGKQNNVILADLIMKFAHFMISFLCLLHIVFSI